MNIIKILLCLFCVSCCAEVEEENMSKIVGSFTSVMHRTASLGSAAAGLPALNTSNFIPGVQQALHPGEYTLQFQVLPPPDGQGFACYAIVDWKLDGQQIRRKVSVFSGAAITGMAESIDVKIVDVSGVGTTGFPTVAQKYKVAMTLSRGKRGDIQQPPILITQPDAIEFGTPAPVFLIPQDAGVVSAMVLTTAPDGTQDGLTKIIVQQITTGGLPTQSYHPDTIPGAWIPISPLAVQLSILNSDTENDPPLGNVIWGIEG